MIKDGIILKSENQKSAIKIKAGELVSYTFDGEELIHQKGSPGWENSDTEMFPIIGPVKANEYRVNTNKGLGIQDQHGFLKDLNYNLIQSENHEVTFEKNYKGNSKIENSLFPKRSTEREVFWPFDFTFSKSFKLTNEALHIEFVLNAEKGMPFMLGYHPAFKLSGNNNEHFIVSGKRIDLQEVIDKGGPSFPFFNVDGISLFKKEGHNVSIKTKGFKNMMLWTEVNNMVCMEPITQYPDLKNQNYSESNLRILQENKELFTVKIAPF